MNNALRATVALEPGTPASSNESANGVWIGRMRIVGEVLLELPIHLARSDEKQYWSIDLNEFLLPPTALEPRPTKLASVPILREVMIKIADALINGKVASKSSHLVAKGRLIAAAKFFEYCWLHGIYSPVDFPQEMWAQLLEDIKQGGWGRALDLEGRARSLAENIGWDEYLSYYRIEKDKSNARLLVKRTLLSRLGTNARHFELVEMKNAVIGRAPHLSSVNPSRIHAGSFSALTRICCDLAALSDLPDSHRVTSVPVQNPYGYAQQHGRPQSRTKSFSPTQAARLLCKSYEWISTYADPIVNLVAALQKYATTKRQRYWLKRIQERHAVEELLNVRVAYLGKNRFDEATSVCTLLKMLLTACFNIIAMMNGRRKDEVIGPRIGLYDGALIEEDAMLGLYKCHFYIEKTDRDYLPFYVNEMTREAIRVVERISKLAWGAIHVGRLTQTERKLFVLRWSASRKKISYFQYEAKNTDIFNRLALEDQYINVKSHMFRRGYALVHNYRFEIGDLLSLSRQLRHKDLGMTQHYILEPESRDLTDRAETLWALPRDRDEAHDIAHARVLAAEVEKVSKEKLHAVISEILVERKKSSGGFWRLVNRFHKELGRHIEYRDLDEPGQAKRLSELLLDRGYRPRAFAHGDCNAGIAKPSARCYSSAEKKLRHDQASAQTCHSCPYHRCSQQHLASLSEEMNAMAAQLDSLGTGTLKRRHAEVELQNLTRVVDLHRQRLGHSS